MENLYIAGRIEDATVKAINSFLAQLHTPTAMIHIYSKGGEVNPAIEIAQKLQEISSSGLIGFGHTEVASAALLIHQACGFRRIATPDTKFLLHRIIPASGEIITEKHLMAERSIFEFYVRTTGRTIEEIYALADKNVYLTAIEAQAFGFISNIIEHPFPEGVLFYCIMHNTLYMPPILYEDEYVIVLNKPAGLVVHGDGRNEFETLADILMAGRPELTDIGEPMVLEGKTVKRPGIVHRLDKDTSGCLLIAKNQESFLFFKKQFQDHTIKKTYHACLLGVPKEREGVITAPIGRARDDVRKWTVGRGARGELREAITQYKVLADIGGTEGKGSTEDGVYSYVEAKPETGRTHQLRVHFKSLNHPIISDALYAPGRDTALGFARMALHAREIVFAIPTGEVISIAAPYPDDFKAARSEFGL